MPKETPISHEELVQAENMLDNMIHLFMTTAGVEDEAKAISEARVPLQKKLKEVYPDAKWSF